MLSEDMCQRNHETGLKMITRGGQHQKVFNIFGNNKPKIQDLEGWKYKHPFEDIFWEEIYIYQVVDHVHVMLPIKFMPKVFATF